MEANPKGQAPGNQTKSVYSFRTSSVVVTPAEHPTDGSGVDATAVGAPSQSSTVRGRDGSAFTHTAPFFRKRTTALFFR